MANQPQLGYINPSTPYQNAGGDSLGYFNPTTPYQNTPAPNTGPTESGTAPGQAGQPGLFSGITSGLGSLLSGQNLGNLALYGGLYSLIGSQAKSAAAENTQLAGQIGAIGQPAVNQSQSLLGSYSSGQLTDPFASQLSSALTANRRTAESEQSQSAQLLANASGGQNVQSALAGQSQQIQQAKTQADTQAVSNAFTSELSASEGLLAAGGPYVQAGIVQTIQSNTALQAQLADLMGSLANAYAKSLSGTGTQQQQKPTAGAGSGGGSGAGGGAGAGAGAGGFPAGGGGLPGYGPGVSNQIPPPGIPNPALPYVGITPPGQIGYTPPNFAPPGGNVSTGPFTGYDPASGLPYVQPGAALPYSAPNFGGGGGGGGDEPYWGQYGG